MPLADKLVLFAGENLELRRQLDELEMKAKLELGEAQKLANELMEQLAGKDAEARTKGKFQLALNKLNSASKEIATSKVAPAVKFVALPCLQGEPCSQGGLSDEHRLPQAFF